MILKVIRYRTGKYTVCRRVSAFFCLEISQTVGVKGLTHNDQIMWSPKGKQHPCNHYLCNL